MSASRTPAVNLRMSVQRKSGDAAIAASGTSTASQSAQLTCNQRICPPASTVSRSAGGTLSEAGAGGTATTNGGTFAGGKTGAGGTLAGGTAGSGGAVSCTAGQCTAQCPCATIGQGTCSDSNGCSGGLVCGVGTGAKFGLTGNTCVPKHCDDNVVNADETSVDCGGECGCKG